jgi:branched-chain amino acid transport system ATP-binding protein
MCCTACTSTCARRDRGPAGAQRLGPQHHRQGHHGPGGRHGLGALEGPADPAASKAFEIAHAGIGYVPENRDIFPTLTVHQNLGVLSGGEQQMLTLCRTLMGDPELIMIDEPTEGLAPKIVELVAEYLRELKRRGIAVLLVEQKLTIALQVADRCLVMGHGQIVFEGTPAELRANAYIRKEWLEV